MVLNHISLHKYITETITNLSKLMLKIDLKFEEIHHNSNEMINFHFSYNLITFFSFDFCVIFE